MQLSFKICIKKQKQMDCYYWINNLWNYSAQATPLRSTFIHNFEPYASFDSPT